MRILIAGGYVEVDKGDLPILRNYAWYVHKQKFGSYARADVWVRGKRFGLNMHRLLLGMPKCEIDHKNRNGLDNRKANLRLCSSSGNQYNRMRRGMYCYKGVTQYNKGKYFVARIMADGKRVTVGNKYKTAREAAEAYDIAAIRLHGKFACLNFKSESSE